MSRALSPQEQALAAYQWLTVADIMREMRTSRQTVTNLIKAGKFGDGGVTRWGREYRIRPEAFESYKARQAASVKKSDAA